MPLHTDIRPSSFDQIIGNDLTVKSIQKHLNKDNPNRSILITGPSGCGKTTMAICIANELNCDPTWNLTMLNASDFRGIDTIRELRETSSRLSFVEGIRIWILEECHQISRDGQEAILKLLEEPPKDCWFILTTTNPEKLKITLRRRCTEFQMNPIDDANMYDFLCEVLEKTNSKKIPNKIIKKICRDSLGSPGIALNILDKVLTLDENDMEDAIQKMTENQSSVVIICKNLLSGSPNWNRILKALEDIQKEEPETIRRQILEYLNKIGLYGDNDAFYVGRFFDEADCIRNGRWALYAACYSAFLDRQQR